MKIDKAVITAAGRTQRHLPLQTVVDREGRPRKVLSLLIEETASAGIEEIGIVIGPGTEPLYREIADDVSANLSFIEQDTPRGYGHAVLTAAPFLDGSPFVLMVSDHLYVSDEADRTCTQQLVTTAEEEDCIVSAVQPTHESKLSYFGAIGGQLFEKREHLYETQAVMEKPTPTAAEQHLMIPGLRHGYYLCFLGMHALNHAVIEILEHNFRELPEGDSLDLSPALDEAAGKVRYLARAIHGRRYDLDHRHGLLMAQLAIALSGRLRDEVLSGIIEVLAQEAK